MEGFGGNLGGEADRAFENWGAVGKEKEESNEEEEENGGEETGEGSKEEPEEDSANVRLGFVSNVGLRGRFW